MRKFMVRFRGDFYASELYDAAGREVFTLEEAVAVAEARYPGEWVEVYNGVEGQQANEYGLGFWYRSGFRGSL